MIGGMIGVVGEGASEATERAMVWEGIPASHGMDFKKIEYQIRI